MLHSLVARALHTNFLYFHIHPLPYPRFCFLPPRLFTPVTLVMKLHVQLLSSTSLFFFLSTLCFSPSPPHFITFNNVSHTTGVRMLLVLTDAKLCPLFSVVSLTTYSCDGLKAVNLNVACITRLFIWKALSLFVRTIWLMVIKLGLWQSSRFTRNVFASESCVPCDSVHLNIRDKANGLR